MYSVFPLNVQVDLFLLVFTRITAILVLLPIYGQNGVPPLLRIGLAAVVALLVAPQLDAASVQIPQQLVPFVVALVQEAFIGIVLGFTTTVLFATVSFAGRLIDMEMGFALVQLIDPVTEQETTTTG